MHSFLHAIGATVDDDNCAFAGEPNSFDGLAQNIIVPLSHYGVLTIQGAEAEQFLQGQITCSAVETTPTLSSPGAFCTPKGRVVTSFQLLRPQPDTFWLRMRSDTLDVASRSFGKYIVFSKAKLAIAESIIGIGLYGTEVGATLSELIDALPTQQNGCVSHADGLLWQCDAAGTQYEYWGSVEAAMQVWSHCAQHCVAVGSRYWRWLQIRSGGADICATTSEMFLPHMLNYHETGAINFSKGCYTGQEIVARTHYRGQVKRHLLRAIVTGPAPTPGSDVTLADGKVVGNVVDSVTTGADTAELLAVVADESAETSAVLQCGDAKLEALAPTYAIP
ncbi:MAG TPA: hypothetical protein VFM32_03450 [Spongiibacteraceae bacterium]|nr:hypothetical protein [Spongiibacteraceae bacterium]